MKRNLHYLITRIINPHLNLVITILRSDSRVIHGRDGYTGLRWVDHALGDMFASELERWRDELWYKYSDSDFISRGKEIIDSLLEILIRIDAKLPDDVNKYRLMDELWEMAGKVEKYLGIEGYITSKKDYFNAKVKSIRKHDEELRKKVQREKKGRQVKTSRVVTFVPSPKSLAPTGAAKGYLKMEEGNRDCVAVILILILLGGLIILALDHFIGRGL